MQGRIGKWTGGRARARVGGGGAEVGARTVLSFGQPDLSGPAPARCRACSLPCLLGVPLLCFSTLSLVPDIGWIWQPLVGSNSDSASSALRAGRASRAGTRAGRVVRLVRLFRIVKLYKHMVNTQAQAEKMKRKHMKRGSLSSTGSTEASPHGKRSVKIDEPSQVAGGLRVCA
jgi:hypothetical protein